MGYALVVAGVVLGDVVYHQSAVRLDVVAVVVHRYLVRVAHPGYAGMRLPGNSATEHGGLTELHFQVLGTFHDHRLAAMEIVRGHVVEPASLHLLRALTHHVRLHPVAHLLDQPHDLAVADQGIAVESQSGRRTDALERVGWESLELVVLEVEPLQPGQLGESPGLDRPELVSMEVELLQSSESIEGTGFDAVDLVVVEEQVAKVGRGREDGRWQATELVVVQEQRVQRLHGVEVVRPYLLDRVEPQIPGKNFH